MSWTTGYFMLSGEFDPDYITQQLGIEPTWVQRIGDPGQPGSRKGAEWYLSCDDVGVVDTSEQTIDVDDQIIALVCKLRPKQKLVSELSLTYSGTFHIHQLFSIRHIGFFLTPEVLHELASLNVYVECTYFEAESAAMGEVTSAD